MLHPKRWNSSQLSLWEPHIQRSKYFISAYTTTCRLSSLDANINTSVLETAREYSELQLMKGLIDMMRSRVRQTKWKFWLRTPHGHTLTHRLAYVDIQAPVTSKKTTIINSIEQFPASEVISRSAGQEIPCILKIPKVHNRVCKIPPLALMLWQ
jgi:hypothetical protein